MRSLPAVRAHMRMSTEKLPPITLGILEGPYNGTFWDGCLRESWRVTYE